MKRFHLILVTAGFALTTLFGTAPLCAQVLPSGQSTQASATRVDTIALRELLVKGLRVTRDDEKAYINWVIQLVSKKKLPVSLVYASFRYARTRRPSYPFPYFVFSLETLAKRNNIDMTDDTT